MITAGREIAFTWPTWMVSFAGGKGKGYGFLRQQRS